ncbi:MAG: response regulator transcription factor [Phycisphaerales bacterium]|nr:response regulator transcription factor [Phycisphaerales bacterium]
MPEKARKTQVKVAVAVDATVTRVLCVDDQAVVVEGLKAHFAVERQFEVVGHLASAAKLIDEVKRLTPNVVLLESHLPGPDVFEMVARLRDAHPDVHAILLSAHVRDTSVSASFAAGARGYFSKSDDLDEILSGIKTIVASRPGTFLLGAKVREQCMPPVRRMILGMSSAACSSLGAMTSGGAPDTNLKSLTPREADVVRLVGRGLTRSQIAAQLCRSAKTVDAHQARAMKKLQITSRSDLVRFAIREGLAHL